ncbi:arylsulfotransferase family protein [Novosphingobium sp. 9]|uniref:arylsulfotransferase family protein n=1 Tax=Novosphingobium sp. 9 TaxID=2025349 RepID=UPI0021B6C059|nr:arylsulfotransferase family protein [Novosphingobium sp. 9]
MSASRLLLHARTGLLALCCASLCAAGGRWAVENPDGMGAPALKVLAKAPGFAADTIGDLVRNPFDESLTPDAFAGKHDYLPVPDHTGHGIDGLVMRRDLAGPTPLPGWRLLVGIFEMQGRPGYAVLAISPQMAIERVWPIEGAMLVERHLSVGQAPFPHGFAVLPDGSMVLGFDSQLLPVRFNACGQSMWIGDERLTHAINPTDDNRFAWSIGAEDDIRKIDLASGHTVRDITVDAIRKANPDLTVLEMRRVDDNALGQNPRGDAGRYYHDAFHTNDAEPLPAAYAKAFPEFRAGDLLVSMRSLNLVMVVDPATLKVKWHANDVTLRQHDPDWEPDGTITVFDNQNGRQSTRIVRFDPRNPDSDHNYAVALAGGPLDFYSRIRGKHQSLPDGGMLITSSEQGRIFETDAQGRIAMEMLVHDPEQPGQNFVVSEARWFPTDSPTLHKVLSCPAKSSSAS